MEHVDKIVMTIVGCLGLGLLFIIIVLGLCGAIDLVGGFVSAKGWNVFTFGAYSIHIHKTLFGYLAIIAGSYLLYAYDCKYNGLEWKFGSLFLVIAGALIISYDLFVFGVWIPAELV